MNLNEYKFHCITFEIFFRLVFNKKLKMYDILLKYTSLHDDG